LFAVTPALAQPVPKTPQPAPAPAPRAVPPAPKAAATGEDMSAFETEINALFVNGGLTADQAAGRAGKVSPTVARRVAEVQAAIASQESASLARVPLIGGKAAYTKLSPIDPISFGSMFPPIEIPDNSYTVQGQVSVALSDYVLRFPKLVEAAKLGVAAARTNQASSEINAAQEARVAYYEWVRSQLTVIVAERQHTQVEAVLKQVRALADAQRLSKADLMRVESNEAESARELDQLRYLSALREEQLRLLIGAGPEEKLEVGEDARADVTAPAPAALDDLMKLATAKRLEFRALDLGIKAREKQREVEKANQLPRLSAFATADFANPNPRIFPQKDQFDFTWQAGVQLSWTLNDALQSRATERRITAETNELRADREALLRGTRIEVLSAEQGVQTAQLSLATTQKGLAAAEEGYRVRRELLNAERATAVELVDAEADLTRARIAAINARVNLRIAIAALAHALGQDTAAAR
jgi:outer membrane protein TolC